MKYGSGLEEKVNVVMLFLGAHILRKFEYRATTRLFMMMILIMTFYANWNVQQLSRPSNH